MRRRTPKTSFNNEEDRGFSWDRNRQGLQSFDTVGPDTEDYNFRRPPRGPVGGKSPESSVRDSVLPSDSSSRKSVGPFRGLRPLALRGENAGPFPTQLPSLGPECVHGEVPGELCPGGDSGAVSAESPG
ncbi:hypothetical protein J1605_015657 [Eschrichtius robustus]|uniref:Uncharacterized protein n=1 Tax=Eschrichtius robustus TaxID=9764 RepID=A0AB34GDG8_ESCRO|nr:hypothetical protein J1605_015657 [Eschrichtius robustus]